MILTYHDNEGCPDHIIFDLNLKMKRAFYDIDGDWNDEKNIKSSYWANWCRVYITGEIGNIEGAILNNWTITDSIPPDARLLGVGLDFGYTNRSRNCKDMGYKRPARKRDPIQSNLVWG